MIEWLNKANIEYHHIRELGGRRRLSSEVGITLNEGWNNQSFHNYADHTLTEEFQKGLTVLCDYASKKRTSYFCSERHPSRCHRLLISNILKVDGWDVKHIIDTNDEQIEAVTHELGKWGAMPIIEEDGTIVYPKL